MKKHIIQTCLVIASLLPAWAQGQSIRKDYREFTQKEMSDFVAAVNDLEFIQGGLVSAQFAYLHNTYYCFTHSAPHPPCGFGLGTNGEFFLPWHRVFLLDFEEQLRKYTSTPALYDYLAVPYWDWSTDNNAGWDSPNFLDEANFLHWAQFGGTNRFLGANGSLPSATDLNALSGLTSFWSNAFGYPQANASDFSHRLEYWSNETRTWVGSYMDTYDAPLDPAFFLNIAMVDKLWQDKEDAAGGQLFSYFPNGSFSVPGYYQTADDVIDSRYIPPVLTTGGRDQDVWYASQGKVILDGADGVDFVASDLTTPYLYRYTAAVSPGNATVAGEIYVGDVQRDPNNSNSIIPDSKGGFAVDPGVTCDFRAGKAIHFLPGTTISYGATSEAKIIAAPNGFAPQTLQNAGALTNNSTVPDEAKRATMTAGEFQKATLRCFPNPATVKVAFEYSLPEAATVTLSILDMMGRTVSQVVINQEAEAGIHHAEYRVESLPKGVYSCRLQAGQQTITQKMLVQ